MYRTSLLFSFFILSFNCFTLTTQAQSGGKASYYSNGLHGRRMSNGERYDRNGFTCAHKTLPFGTKLKVTNPRNGKSVIVRVTDRGPFVPGRVIDLSYAAAKELGFLSSGVIYVKVELAPKETEIPFVTEPTNALEIPEVEYGTAGICYEFIPEWEKAGEDKPKEIERKVKTKINKKNISQQTRIETTNNGNGHSGRIGQANPTHQQATSNAKNNVQENSKSNGNTNSSKKGSSSSWTNFFQRVKDGVTGLFD